MLRGLDGLFDGNFASGDLLIQTPNGARQLTLGSNQPVKSVGTQIAANAFVLGAIPVAVATAVMPP